MSSVESVSSSLYDFSGIGREVSQGSGIIPAATEVVSSVFNENRLMIESATCPFDLAQVIGEGEISYEARFLLNFVIFREFSISDVNWNIIKGLLIKRNEPLLAECRVGLQRIFEAIGEKLESVEEGSDQEKHFEMLIADLLTFYPFLEPKQEQFTVPQKIEGAWEMVTYNVESVRLKSPVDFGPVSPEPLHFYGLTSEESVSAQPLLLYRGTPPPTTTGSALATWVDFIPGFTVGEVLFNASKEVIGGWLEEHATQDKQAKIYGKSLGGALGLLTAVEFAPIVEVHAFNPPGLLWRMYRKFEENLAQWRQDFGADWAPSISVYSNENDPVSELGDWPEGTVFYKVIPEEKTNIYFAHIQTFFGKTFSVIKQDGQSLNGTFLKKMLFVAFLVGSAVLFTFNTLGLIGSVISYSFRNALGWTNRERALDVQQV